MILSAAVRAYVCVEPIDMRKNIDTLACLVQPLFGMDACSGHVFVFFGKRRNKVKLLVWDRHGFWLLSRATVDENLQFVRYFVDPRKAEGKRLAFTITAEGDPRIRRVELRNSVLVISDAGAKAPLHVDLTRRELAELVLGKGLPLKGSDALAQLDQVLDRSQLMPPAASVPKAFEITGKQTYSDDLEH